MQSLQDLAPVAVPKPSVQAQMFLVPCHPVTKKLKQREYREMRAQIQREHVTNFRLVLQDIQFFRNLISNLNWPVQLILLLLAL